MPTLLDTHAWIWWVTADRRLSKPARRAIEQGVAAEALWLSQISVWESHRASAATPCSMALRAGFESRRSAVTHQIQACVSRNVGIPALGVLSGLPDSLNTLPPRLRCVVDGPQGRSFATGRPRFVMTTTVFVLATDPGFSGKRP